MISSLSKQQEGELLDTMRKHSEAIRWNVYDLKGTNSLKCEVDISYEEGNPGGGHSIDFIVNEDEDPMSYKEEARGCYPLHFHYEGANIFDPGWAFMVCIFGISLFWD